MTCDTARRPRVVLAEDDATFRYIVKMLIQKDCDVIGEAIDGASAVELVDELCPDVVLLDISMPVMTGLEAARLIRARLPDIRIIIFSSDTTPAYIEEAARIGVHGYVVKGPETSRLLQAIQDALNGKAFRSA